jgi:hypothetical protein
MGEESKGMLEASEEMVRVIEGRREGTEECKKQSNGWEEKQKG